MSFNEAGAEKAPETPLHRRLRPPEKSFNEAGAEKAPETMPTGGNGSDISQASMRPGPKRPRKPSKKKLRQQ